MFFLKRMFNYFRFLIDIIKYNVKITYFFNQFVDESVKIIKNLSPLLFFISCTIGLVFGINTFQMLSVSFFSTLGVSSFVPKGLVTAALTEVAPCFTFIMYLGQYAVPTSMQIYKMREDGYFDSFNFSGINSASYVCLAKILSTFFVLPILCVLCCFFILLGGVLSCTLYSNINVSSFLEGYVSVYNRERFLLCILKAWFFCLIGCFVASYVGFYYKIWKNEDISKIGIRCFSSCWVVFLICDFIFDFLFFLVYYK